MSWSDLYLAWRFMAMVVFSAFPVTVSAWTVIDAVADLNALHTGPVKNTLNYSKAVDVSTQYEFNRGDFVPAPGNDSLNVNVSLHEQVIPQSKYSLDSQSHALLIFLALAESEDHENDKIHVSPGVRAVVTGGDAACKYGEDGSSCIAENRVPTVVQFLSSSDSWIDDIHITLGDNEWSLCEFQQQKNYRNSVVVLLEAENSEGQLAVPKCLESISHSEAIALPPDPYLTDIHLSIELDIYHPSRVLVFKDLPRQADTPTPSPEPPKEEPREDSEVSGDASETEETNNPAEKNKETSGASGSGDEDPEDGAPITDEKADWERWEELEEEARRIKEQLGLLKTELEGLERSKEEDEGTKRARKRQLRSEIQKHQERDKEIEELLRIERGRLRKAYYEQQQELEREKENNLRLHETLESFKKEILEQLHSADRFAQGVMSELFGLTSISTSTVNRLRDISEQLDDLKENDHGSRRSSLKRSSTKRSSKKRSKETGSQESLNVPSSYSAQTSIESSIGADSGSERDWDSRASTPIERDSGIIDDTSPVRAPPIKSVLLGLSQESSDQEFKRRIRSRQQSGQVREIRPRTKLPVAALPGLTSEQPSQPAADKFDEQVPDISAPEPEEYPDTDNTH